MFKKITLLAMALGALMAFVIPAAASAAPIWTVNGVAAGKTTAKGTAVDGTGTLSATTTVPGVGPIELGPCLVHMKGILWNEGGKTATGDITSLTIDGQHIVGGKDLCQVWNMTAATGSTTTTLCDITSASTNASVAAPWHVDALTGATGIKVTGANFTDTFSNPPGGCVLGASTSANGTATGTFANGDATHHSSIVFADDGDMIGAALNPVFLDGSVSVTGEKGTELITLDP